MQVRLDPQGVADSRIRRQIFVHRKSTEKNSTIQMHCRILSVENPPKKIRIFE